MLGYRADAEKDGRADYPLVTWLASYPRSGNTLLRIILNCCFGQLSQSVYSDSEFSDPFINDVVGHQAVGANPHGFLREARQRKQRLFVKTHERPGQDSHPAIYVLRDGRSSVVSHCHFLSGVLGKDVRLADVISGNYGVSWSEHVRAWTSAERSNLLIVRYEDLASGKASTLDSISNFIGHPISREFDMSFETLQAKNPSFFRRGSDRSNIAEMDRDSLELFERLHGETLRMMGYGTAPIR